MDIIVLVLISSPVSIIVFVIFYTRKQNKIRKQKLLPFVVDLGFTEQQMKYRKGLLDCKGSVIGMTMRLHEQKVAQRKIWTSFSVSVSGILLPLVVSDTSRRVEIYASFDKNLTEVNNHDWIDKIKILTWQGERTLLSNEIREIIGVFAGNPKGFIEISEARITYCYPGKLWDESDFRVFQGNVDLVLKLASK